MSTGNTKNVTRLPVVLMLAAVGMVISLTGCGNKTAENTPTGTAPAPAASTGASSSGDQGTRVTTGADPDKAPPMPKMYGGAPK